MALRTSRRWKGGESGPSTPFLEPNFGDLGENCAKGRFGRKRERDGVFEVASRRGLGVVGLETGSLRWHQEGVWGLLGWRWGL